MQYFLIHIKYLKIGLLITAAQLILASGCIKTGTKPCYNFTPYNFDATASIYPQQEAYHIGDTIFFTSKVPTALFDKLSNQSINYSNAVSLFGHNGISYIDTIGKQVVAARDSFTLHPVAGSFVEDPGNKRAGINTSYFEYGNFYQFTGGFICEKKGIYYFGIGDLLSPGLNGKDCTKATFKMMLTNIDNHISLYQYALEVLPDADGMKRIYCFSVQ